ncbi:PREDICTED: uncharacterized protein LOC106309030 [Brassica oleracea var. oleracea]|uniref:uncharacterized protein LOC106309030 n=1 Tax=Brassica oleracea var. oleracea TaxID=109376 RepID=UPI0006A748B4|nr:PREDICTED: uncharacterized protein LOC106309030 [Brassica oleracea var. oleracea]
MVWLATRNRLVTMDRVASWSKGVDTSCVLRKNAPETRNHLFFECSVSSQIWKQLTQGILQSSFVNTWDALSSLIIGSSMGKQKRFCLRFAFQTTIYTLWRERNNRRHGEAPAPPEVLLKLIDKAVRNKLSLMQSKRVKSFDGVLPYWFSTRL